LDTSDVAFVQKTCFSTMKLHLSNFFVSAYWGGKAKCSFWFFRLL